MCVCVYVYVYMSLCVCMLCVRVCVPDSLLGLGGHQHPQGATDAEGLVDHGLHLGEGPEEHQVLVDGEDLPAHLQTCHLENTQREEEGSPSRFLFPSDAARDKRIR